MSELPLSLPGRVRHWARLRPDRPALREKRLGVWECTSWSGYLEGISSAGRMLWELGVRPGEAVAILSDNRTEWLYADLGAQGISARSVGIYQTNPAPEVAYVVRHSGAVVLFCEDQEQVDKAIEIREECPELRHVITFDPRGTRGYDDPRLMSWQEFVGRGKELIEREPDWFSRRLDAPDPDACSMIVYTSGTTGEPKGAMLSSRNAVEISVDVADTLEIGESDSVLSYLPLCHVAEKIFTLYLPLAVGCVVHFGESIDTVRVDLQEVSPTIFLGVPRIWEKMNASVTLKIQDSSRLKRWLYERAFGLGQRSEALAQSAASGEPPSTGQRLKATLSRFLADLFVFRALQERLGLRRCRLPISGAAPIAPELLRWYHALGIPILEGFGMTECAGMSHVNLPGENRVGSVGKALPGVEHGIAADGELLLRGSHVFLGYLHNPEATAETIDEEGWLHTGDIGSIEDGFLSITGRKKEIIITAGGKNISPEHIENTLKTSPFIKEAIVIGDGRKFIAALVQIEYESVGDWAGRRGVTWSSFGDLSSRNEVRSLIDKEIRTANELLARVEQVRNFHLLPKELHQDDGELTATQKVRRRAVEDRYPELIESLYRG